MLAFLDADNRETDAKNVLGKNTEQPNNRLNRGFGKRLKEHGTNLRTSNVAIVMRVS